MLFRMQSNKLHFIDVCIRTKTGGKTQVDLAKGRLYTSKKYGNFIILKGHKMPLPRFDQEVFLPRRKSGRMFLDVTASDGYFYANEYKKFGDKLRRKMQLVDEGGKVYDFDNKEDMEKFINDKYKIVDYADFGGIVNPVPHVDRSQARINEEIILAQTKESIPFWKLPQFIFLATILISAIILIVVVVLALQHAETLAGAAPASKGIVNSLANNLNNASLPPSP